MFQLGDRNREHSRIPPELAIFGRRLAAVGELLLTRDGVTAAFAGHPADPISRFDARRGAARRQPPPELLQASFDFAHLVGICVGEVGRFARVLFQEIGRAHV
jgi:hypothetical protein